MVYITEPSKRIPVAFETDVVVCGGGPSGFIAAIASARSGARTLLLERYGFLGGMATAGLVGPISKFNLSGERIVMGIPGEFIHNMAAQNGAIVDLQSGNIPYDAEVYKYSALNMTELSGAKILFHAQAVDCFSDNSDSNAISHLIIESKSGRQAIRTKFVIDCTGTGDIVVKSGAAWEMRNIKNGELQPMSLCFRLGGVDTSSLNTLMAYDGVKYANSDLNTLLKEEITKGRLQNFGGPWAVHGSTIRPGEISVNGTRYRGDATSETDISNAESQLRHDVMLMVDVFRKNIPAFRNAYLIDTATQVGIRETRGIKGLYEMTADDVLNPRYFADTVALGGHPIDIHRAGSPVQEVKFLTEPYHIPYRALVPQDTRNLLVAGGCVSATREAFASIRVQAQCMALGQAAGTAAAMCISESIGASELDGTILNKFLKQQGAIV